MATNNAVLIEKFKETRTKLEKARTEYIALGRSIFEDLSKEFFKQFPKVNGFSWVQGTPSWCDGDPCSFYVYAEDSYLSVFDKNGEWNNWEEISDDDKDDAAYHASQLVYSIPYDILEELFGDGVEVKVTTEGVSTSSYFVE